MGIFDDMIFGEAPIKIITRDNFMKGDDWLYRVQDNRNVVHVVPYKIIRRTKSGFWITDMSLKDRWVNNYSKKRFAYPTKERAWENFVARKLKQIFHLDDKLKYINKILEKYNNEN